MISYCLVAYRPPYARRLVEELARKTSVPYEILVWVNCADGDFIDFLVQKRRAGVPIELVGVTPENIGMEAFKTLFSRARHEMIVQMDDDVVLVSRNAAQRAHELFVKHRTVGQIVADCWQDAYTNGARPGHDRYRTWNAADGLYVGPVDGWFSIYHRRALPTILRAPFARYAYIGSWVAGALRQEDRWGLLCSKLRVLHVTGPVYASYFGMLDFEIEKYKSLGLGELAQVYEKARSTLPPRAAIDEAFRRAEAALDNPVQEPWRINA